MNIQEFPKWIYPAGGPAESYAPGDEPVLVQDADEEKAFLAQSKRSRRKAAATEAE